MMYAAKARCRSFNLLSRRSVGTIFGPEKIDPRHVDETPVIPDLRSTDFEDKELLENALGFPVEQLQRTVVIKQECKSATQSGRSPRHRQWIVHFKREEMWTNPLMGWACTRDPMYQIFRTLRFDTLEEAQTWATTNGFGYEIDAQTSPLTSQSDGGYASKFAYKPPRPNFDPSHLE